MESEALYHILENDVVPLFYDRDGAGIPRGWLAKMKASMKRLSPIFSTNRMVAEYAERFYLPAANRLIRLAGDRGRVRSLIDWRKRLHVHGSDVNVTQVDVDGGSREYLVGSKVKVTARVSLGSLAPGDVRVQAYYGALTADGKIGKGSHVDLALRQSVGTDHVYEGEVECGQSGSCGIRLTDESVSRRHCALEIVATGIRITDLESTNGTFVDRTKIVEAELQGGEVVRFGISYVGIVG